MLPTDSELIEIFSAIQGEGPIIGQRQVFVRFGKCDVVCDYCDTPECHSAVPVAKVESGPATREFEEHANPISVESLAEFVRRVAGDDGLHHSISLTGGEPLIHAKTILALHQELADLRLPFYLETDGHLVKQLEVVLDVIDLVGMDIKIKSSAGFEPKFERNRAFLKTLIDANKDVFVKIVVSNTTTTDELKEALDVVQSIEPSLVTILQPVTPFAGKGIPPSPEQLLELDRFSRTVLPEIRVIPQTHKMLDQL